MRFMGIPKTGQHLESPLIDARVSFSIVIPTLNEAGNIERMIRTLGTVLSEAGRPDFEIIVVDDHSADGTGQIADQIAAEMPGHVRVIHRTGKASLGTAAVAGWDAAQGDVLALMDADFQHPPDLIPRLMQAIDQGADIAIGSRYAEGGAMSEHWNIVRKMISALGTSVVRFLLGPLRHVSDPFSGCFAMRRPVIEGTRLHPEGFKVLMEVLATGKYEKVRDVPFRFSERTAGESKLRLRVAIDDFRLLLRLAWQTRRNSAKQ
jgi:dolichol-phosphate mannosyltransferase